MLSFILSILAASLGKPSKCSEPVFIFDDVSSHGHLLEYGDGTPLESLDGSSCMYSNVYHDRYIKPEPIYRS